MELDNDDRQAAIKSIKDAREAIEQGNRSLTDMYLQYALNSLSLPGDAS